MQNLYDKMVIEFLDAIEKYMNDELSLEELFKLQEREKLIFEHESWPVKRAEAKDSVFQLSKHLFTQINECDQKIREFELIHEDKVYDIDESSLMSHATLLSRNKAPPAGFEGSNWYLGPYPTIQMIEALVTIDQESD